MFFEGQSLTLRRLWGIKCWKKASKNRDLRLKEQHEIRVRIARDLLPDDPLDGFAPIEAASEAREKALKFLCETTRSTPQSLNRNSKQIFSEWHHFLTTIQNYATLETLRGSFLKHMQAFKIGATYSI